MSKKTKPKFQMPKLLKKILIITSIVLASILIIGFILYKIFVTPEVKVMLSLLNAKEDITTSLNFYVDDDEAKLIEHASKRCATSNYNFTLSKSPMFEGVSASLTTNGNKLSTVSDLTFNRFFTFDVYADKNEVLINVPVIDGGFRIPMKTKKEDWKDSAFFDAYNTLPQTEKNEFIEYLSNNNIDFRDFLEVIKPELIELIKQVDVSKEGTEKIKIGDNEKKAEVFSLNLSKSNMNKLADIIEKYLKKRDIVPPENLRPTLINFAKDNKVLLKIRNFNIYEIEIKSKTDKHIVEFSGKKNQFDTMSYYKNGDFVVSRKRTSEREKTTDVLKIKDREILSLKRDRENSSLIFDDGNTYLSIKGSGMDLTESKLSYDTLEIKIGEQFTVTGDYSIEKRTSSDGIEFNKSGTYIDVPTMSSETWNSIIDSFMSALELIPFF